MRLSVYFEKKRRKDKEKERVKTKLAQMFVKLIYA